MRIIVQGGPAALGPAGARGARCASGRTGICPGEGTCDWPPAGGSCEDVAAGGCVALPAAPCCPALSGSSPDAPGFFNPPEIILVYSLGPAASADRLDTDSEDVGGAKLSTRVFAEPEIGAGEDCPLAVKGMLQLASVRFSDCKSALYSPDVLLRSAMLSN